MTEFGAQEFVRKFTNVIQWEDLNDIILVGHSFGGNAISGVADRMPGRIRLLDYLDAIMLEGGQTMFDSLPPEVAATRLKAAQASGGISVAPPPVALFNIGDPQLARYVEAHLTPHPLGTYTSPLNLTHPVGNGLPAVYVQCTQPSFAMLQSSRAWVKAHGMRTVEIKTSHDAMITAPELLSELLMELASQTHFGA